MKGTSIKGKYKDAAWLQKNKGATLAVPGYAEKL